MYAYVYTTIHYLCTINSELLLAYCIFLSVIQLFLLLFPAVRMKKLEYHENAMNKYPVHALPRPSVLQKDSGVLEFYDF